MELKKEWLVPAAVGAGTFLVGGVGGYLIGKRRAVTVYMPPSKAEEDGINEVTQDLKETISGFVEIAEMYLTRYRDLVIAAAGYADVAEDPDEKVKDDQVRVFDIPDDDEPIPTDPEPRRVNVFTRTDIEWDEDVEKSQRTKDSPYVIHKDEFYGNTPVGVRQHQTTYFVGDDVLVDEQDKVIDRHEEYVGTELPFGHGSGDDAIVYIHNPQMKTEYEVVRNNGSYDTEVLGLSAETELEEETLKPRVPKFRDD